MSTHKQVKIAELTPASKGELSLVFEVDSVIERGQVEGKETVTCRVVDETGIITAHFDQYATKFIPGSVFQIQNLRCKVVNHHLRLEMIKTTVVAKQPLKMGFKDRDNDLSAKFYVTATKGTQAVKPPQQEVTKTQAESKPKIQEKQKNTSKQEKHKQKEHKDQKEQEQNQFKSLEKKQKSTKYKGIEEGKDKQVDKEEKREKRYVPKEETKIQKSKLPHQPIQQNSNQQKKTKFVPKCLEIKLQDCPKYQQEEASFCVHINLKTLIKKQNYWMCKVSDSSGSTYFEFSPKVEGHLLDKSWYRFIAFRIFKDRQYGFIATQEKHSSYQLLENWEQTFDKKLLWR